MAKQATEGVPILAQSKNYVRLSPTVLFPVPLCYLSQKPDLSSEKCWLCPVRKQCEERQPIEKRVGGLDKGG